MPSTSASPDPRLRVVIADSDPLARGAVRDVLQAGGRFTVIAAVAGLRDAAELTQHYAPDLLVTELDLPDGDAIALAEQVLRRRPEVRVAVLTKSRDDARALQAVRAGVHGILDKGLAEPELERALREIHAGKMRLPTALVSELVLRFRRAPEPGSGLRPIRSALTNREWEILDLLAKDATTAEIAERLVLTEDTVYSHLKSVNRKLGVHSRADALEAVRELYETPLAA